MRPIRRLVAIAAGALAVALTVPLAPTLPAPVASARSVSPNCGSLILKPGGGWWTCTMVDNFSGTKLDDKYWVGMDAVGSGGQCMLNTPRTVSVSGGSLRLSAIKADATTQCPLRADGSRGDYVAASVTSYYRFSQQYGRFEARMKVPAVEGSGLHEAFWLWPDIRYGSDADWPNTGEIDIAETYSSHPDLVVPFLHYSDDRLGAVDGLNTAWNCKADRGQWHTYALEWTSTKLTIFVDGKTCLVNTAGASAYRKRFIINLSQILGGGNNPWTGAINLPATTEVDYVKVWR